MALRFEQSFVVQAPRQRVWEYLTDPYRVVTALPGAAVTEKVDEATYNGTITVKVGPVSARYRGTARFEKLDPAAGLAEVAASGQDATGRGGAEMKMTSRLLERAPGETEVNVVSEVNVTGVLAQFGRGMIQDVSDQMFERFTAAVRQALETQEAAAVATSAPAAQPGAAAAPPPVAAADAAPAPPIEVLSFGGKIAGRALGRAAQQPLFWLGLAAVVLILFWFLMR
jgi:carbon monoxide dehydrogenase subunit G